MPCNNSAGASFLSLAQAPTNQIPFFEGTSLYKGSILYKRLSQLLYVKLPHRSAPILDKQIGGSSRSLSHFSAGPEHPNRGVRAAI